MGTRNTFSGTLIKTMVCQGHLAKKGQAKVEIIIPNPSVFKSSPLLTLSFQRKKDAVDTKNSIIVIYFSLNTQGQQGVNLDGLCHPPHKIVVVK